MRQRLLKLQCLTRNKLKTMKIAPKLREFIFLCPAGTATVDRKYAVDAKGRNDPEGHQNEGDFEILYSPRRHFLARKTEIFHFL